MKVGKEEAIGMLMAVEMWVKRDHKAEWRQWTSMLEHIDARVRQVAGVTTSMSQPNGLSNRTPSLRVLWDPQQLGITGDAVSRTLFDTEPRIAMSATQERRARRRLRHAVHDGAGRRENHRRASLRCCSRADTCAGSRAAVGARCRSDRPMGRAHRLRRRQLDAHASSAPARQRPSTALTRASSSPAM